MTQQIKELLIKARDVVKAQDHMAKNAYYDVHGCLCTSAAIVQAYKPEFEIPPNGEQTFQYSEALSIEIVRETVEFLGGSIIGQDTGSTYHVFDFNDDPNTDKTKVIAAFDKAIEKIGG